MNNYQTNINDLSNQNNSQGVPPNFYEQQHSGVPSYPFMKPPDYYNNPHHYPQQSTQPITGYNHYPQTNPIVVVTNSDGNNKCKICKASNRSYIIYKPGKITFIWAGLLCLFTGLCCVWIPFVCDDCQDQYYHCQSCNGLQVVNKKC